jgi:small-conductance mechanosensitive channel
METTQESNQRSYLQNPARLAWSLVKSIRIWFVAIVIGYFASDLLEDYELVNISFVVERVARIVLVIAAFLQLGISASVLMRESLERFIARKAENDSSWRTAQGLMLFGLQTVLWSLVLLLTLDNLGIDITALVTGLGIGGIAAALAINNILGDLFASLSIVLDKPFEAGDFIIVGESMGTVERIGIKSTRVRSLSGEQIVFANSDLLSSRIRNYKQMQERRIVFEVGIIYETENEQLRRIPIWLKEIVEKREHVRFDRAHFKSFGSYSLNFEVVYFMLLPDFNAYMDTQQAINQEIFETFAERGVEFAYPTQVEYIRSLEANSSPRSSKRLQ